MADSMQYGSWYNNPAAGGQNMRWFNGVWTTGAEPNAPAGGGGGSTQDYSSIYKNAQSLVPTVDTSALEGVAKDVATHAQQNHDDIMAQIPLTHNVYTDLANELGLQYNKQISATQQQGVADIGQQTDQAARSGFDTTGGYEKSVLRAVQVSYNNQVDQLVNEYGIKRQSIADDEAKSVQELVTDANKALLDGDSQRANILTAIAQIKQGNINAVATVAGQMATVQDNNTKNAIAQQQANTAQYNADTSRMSEQKAGGSGGTDATTSALLALLTGQNTQQPTQPTATAAKKVTPTDGYGNGIDDLLKLNGNTAASLQQKNNDMIKNMNLQDALSGVSLGGTNVATGAYINPYTTGVSSNPNNLGIGK